MFINMKAGKRARALIKYYESLGDGDKKTSVLEPYLDHIGIATLGYGHVLYDMGPNGKLRMIRASTHGGRAGALRAAAVATAKRWGRPHLMGEAEADLLLEEDLNKFSSAISPFFTRHPTKQCEFDALLSLSFNIGVAAFSRSTALRRHNANTFTQSTQGVANIALKSKARSITNGTEAMCAWSYSGDPAKWTLGLFRRRYAESLIYFGSEAEDALLRANAFDG